VIGKWKRGAGAIALVALVALVGPGIALGPAAAGAGRPTTGVGSCTLKGWNPGDDPADAKDLPIGDRHQAYIPDNYDCAGAVFAKPGVEFKKFPQPHNLKITNVTRTETAPPPAGGIATMQSRTVLQPSAAVNPLAPYFPPFTHFVILGQENHTFDDYLGDCASTVIAGCNGQVQSTNHISSVPQLHALAKQYALADGYSTGAQPPSGPNHWWLFSAQSASSSQQQSYPTSTGTQFDRFLGGDSGPSGEGTSACTAQAGTGSGSSPYTFMAAGDFYWMLSSGSGYWRNPATGKLEVLPVNRPGTSIPEEQHYNEYTCSAQNIPDSTVANDYLSFVNSNGLPAYNYVELFNDHPGSFQDIPGNDAATKQIVDSIMGNPSLIGLLGLGLGAIIRHTAAAVAVLVGVVYAGELFIGQLDRTIDAYLPAWGRPRGSRSGATGGLRSPPCQRPPCWRPVPGPASAWQPPGAPLALALADMYVERKRQRKPHNRINI
jgi:hypothetical protein